MTFEVICAKCGDICVVDGDFPKYFAWCDTCHDYAAGFDDGEFAGEVAAGIADSRPEK